jgi:hypothetical protein
MRRLQVFEDPKGLRPRAYACFPEFYVGGSSGRRAAVPTGDLRTGPGLAGWLVYPDKKRYSYVILQGIISL